MENCNDFCKQIDSATKKSMLRSMLGAFAAAAGAAAIMYLIIPHVDIWAFLWKYTFLIVWCAV